MKFVTILATMQVVFGSGLSDLHSHMHLAVEATKEHLGNAAETVKHHASKIPLRKHHVKDKMDFRVKQLPEDFHRRYDETTHKIYARHLKRTGHVSAAASLNEKCITGGPFSFLLGFAYGL